jgi:hypothetical protein
VQTGDLALQLIDGEGVKHIHDRQGHVFSFDYDQPTSIIRDNDRGEYLRYSLRDMPEFIRAEYVSPPFVNDADASFSSDTELENMLPAKAATKAIKKLVKVRGNFEASAADGNKFKNHHPLESVDRNGRALKL